MGQFRFGPFYRKGKKAMLGTRTASVLFRAITALALLMAVVLLTGCSGVPTANVRTPAQMARGLHSASEARRAVAIDDLVKLGPAGVAHLERAAGNPKVRLMAIKALGEVGTRNPGAAKAAAEALVRLLSKGVAEARIPIALALQDIGKPAVPALVRRIITNKTGLQKDALAAVIQVNRKAATAELIKRLSDPADEPHRYQIIKALRVITKLHLGYDPLASAKTKRKAVQSWVNWWDNINEGLDDK